MIPPVTAFPVPGGAFRAPRTRGRHPAWADNVLFETPDADPHGAERVLPRQCLISADPDESVTAQMVEHLGADYFIWASDYPHIDASFGVVQELRERLEPLSEDARRKVLGLNAQRFYRLAS